MTEHAVVKVKDPPGRSISAFSSEDNFQTAQRMAMALCESTLVPSEYKGESGVANTLIAMELANRIGASPLMVMQNLHIVHGKPGWAASFLIATVNASGRFTPLRFDFQGEEGSDDWGCRAVARDVENGDECRGSLVTIALAKAEGWYNKSGSKWKTMPEQMLMYRSAAWWARVYAPELSLGMHTADEVTDMTRGGRSPGATDLNESLSEDAGDGQDEEASQHGLSLGPLAEGAEDPEGGRPVERGGDQVPDQLGLGTLQEIPE